MTQEKLNATPLPGYSGRGHSLIPRQKALELLAGTEFEGHRVIKSPLQDAYPENYFFTLSSFEHVEAHVKCGTPMSVNAFFINDSADSTLLLASIPIKTPEA